jgi:prolyl oligopeptidase
LKLSRGGADATVVREFDLKAKTFVDPDGPEQGFYLPEAKTSVTWKSKDLLIIGTDLGDGQSLTDSGYPLVMRHWARGTPLASAVKTFEGEKTDVAVGGYITRHRDFEYEIRRRSITFYTSKMAILMGETWHELEQLPLDAETGQFADQFMIKLRSDWPLAGPNAGTTLSSGSLVCVDIKVRK